MVLLPHEADDPSGMSESALRAEVWFWRTFIADRIAEQVEGWEEGSQERARSLANALEAALIGNAADRCALCAQPLVPGQAALREATEGDVHASCLGVALGDDGPGERFQLDPDSVVDKDDEPVSGGDGVLIAYAVQPARTTQALVDLINRTRA